MKIFSGQDDGTMTPDDVAHAPASNSKWWHFKSESMQDEKKAICTKEDEACEWATD